MNVLRPLAVCALAGAMAGQIGLPREVHAANTSNSITVTGVNFSSVTKHLSAGLVHLSVMARGSNTDAQINIARLHSAAVKPKVAAGMMKGINAVFPYLTFLGGVGEMAHQMRSASFMLSAGTYVLFDISGLTANKNPHSGYTFITVTGAAQGPAPTSAATVRMVDFKFQTPMNLPRGMATVRLMNAGHEPHELDLERVAPGKTMADVKAALTSNKTPAWITNIGGWGVVGVGQTEWAQLNLTPGNYLLMCWVPDTFSYPGHHPTNKPHVMLGMIKIVPVK